jgi:hypothetical protein
MKPCPFCGHPVDMDNPDTIYPNGIGWKIRENGFKSYCSAFVVPPEQRCYSMFCVETAGGCGAEVSADSKQECIDKWNRRA